MPRESQSAERDDSLDTLQSRIKRDSPIYAVLEGDKDDEEPASPQPSLAMPSDESISTLDSPEDGNLDTLFAKRKVKIYLQTTMIPIPVALKHRPLHWKEPQVNQRAPITRRSVAFQAGRSSRRKRSGAGLSQTLYC
jgi:hypothetical protein